MSCSTLVMELYLLEQILDLDTAAIQYNCWRTVRERRKWGVVLKRIFHRRGIPSMPFTRW